ncbi:MAG: zinc ribbon domain-containing protein [Enterocloster asparagiformis]|nr:zinc ribbon domain-containing protein [Enterocloster asparagiformis]
MADIKGSFSKGLTALNVKTTSFLEEKKIQTYIATLTSEIEALQKEIGTIVYEQWNATGDVPLQMIGEQLLMISQKKQIIQEQTKAAEELVKKEKEILGSGDSVKQERIFCPNCGQAYDSPVKFCKKCGTKLQ